MIREDFLQQNAFHKVDAHCSLGKQYKMLSVIVDFYREASTSLLQGMEVKQLTALPVVEEISKMKYVPEKEFDKKYSSISSMIKKSFTKNEPG
jgi:V/A-type H+-transporting ATPase subunit A